MLNFRSLTRLSAPLLTRAALLAPPGARSGPQPRSDLGTAATGDASPVDGGLPAFPQRPPPSDDAHRQFSAPLAQQAPVDGGRTAAAAAAHPPSGPVSARIVDSLQDLCGDTPLVRVPHPQLEARGVRISVKLETGANNQSIKDRVAYAMILQAEQDGTLAAGDTLCEPTAGNTGIALARAVAHLNASRPDRAPYRMVVAMPENYSRERADLIQAYGAQLVRTPAAEGVEGARRYARKLSDEGLARVLDQFDNPENWRAQYATTGRELCEQIRQLDGPLDLLVLPAGSGGVSQGVVRRLRDEAAADPALAARIAGAAIDFVVPAPGAMIPGIRTWPADCTPANYDTGLADTVAAIGRDDARRACRALAAKGLLLGPSAGAGYAHALARAQALAAQSPAGTEPSQMRNILFLGCDNGALYFSEGLFDEDAAPD